MRYVLLFTVLTISVLAKSQNNNNFFRTNLVDTIFVERSYTNSTEKPKLINANSIVYNNADSVYLVNKIRYQYYERLKAFVDNNDNFNANEVIIKYERLLKENEAAYNRLLENCEKSKQLTDNFVNETEKSLALTNATLDQTQISLENANESLEQANKLLKKSNKKRIWSGLSAGFGGLGIGLLVGILVAK